MAKKKLDLSKLRAASQDASMNMYQNVSHAKHFENEEQEIEIIKILENPYQPRIFMEEGMLEDLTKSIDENGLLQPIVLNKISNDKYYVIAGHRRLAAHKRLNRTHIKATIVTTLDENDENYKIKMVTLALIENLQREDLNIIEIAISFTNILQEKIYKNMDELSKSIGKSKTYISKILKVLTLDDYIIHDITKNKTIKDLEVLYELQKIEDSITQIEIYKSLVKGDMNRKDIQDYNKLNSKVSHAKQTKPYELKKTSKKIILNTNLESLSDDKKEELSKELTTLMAKYFKI